MNPEISIVMPSFQQAEYLKRAVRSVLDQEGVDTELLVFDPGSTDGSREILQQLRDEYGDRLQLHFAPDDGQADAVNRGMYMARADILGWLNSDDRLRPGALRRVVPQLQCAEPRWLYGRCGIIDDFDRPIMPYIVWYKNIRGRNFSLEKLLTEDFVPQMSAFWNRPMWAASGGLDPAQDLAMDYDLFLRFARIAPPVLTRQYLADFRVHSEAKGSIRADRHLREALAVASHHAADLGWRGRLSILLHRIYSARTRIIYRVIKPRDAKTPST